MSLYTGVPQFTRDQIQTYRYWYEAQPFTAFDPSLAAGQEEIFEIQNLADDVVDQLAIISHVATNQQATVTLLLEGPTNTRNEYTAAMPPNLLPAMDSIRGGERSTSKIGLSWNNVTAAAVANMQTNYVGALKRLTTADKVMRGLPLNPTDQRLQKKFQIYNQGLRPLSIPEMLDRIWRRAIIDEDFVAIATDAATSTLALPEYRMPAGTVAVLHRLAGSIPAGDIGNQVQLILDRDSQKNHVEVLLDNAPGLQYPWPMWITAQNTFRISYKAQTATNGIAFRLHWYRVKITGLISVILGQSDPTELTGEELQLYERVRAGVIA